MLGGRYTLRQWSCFSLVEDAVHQLDYVWHEFGVEEIDEEGWPQ